MRIDLISFERQDLYVSIKDRFELFVDGKHYMIVEDFFKPKGNVLQNIRIMDPYLHELKFDTTVVNIPGLMSKGRKGISIKQILMDILNNHKSTSSSLLGRCIIVSFLVVLLNVKLISLPNILPTCF